MRRHGTVNYAGRCKQAFEQGKTEVAAASSGSNRELSIQTEKDRRHARKVATIAALSYIVCITHLNRANKRTWALQLFAS